MAVTEDMLFKDVASEGDGIPVSFNAGSARWWSRVNPASEERKPYILPRPDRTLGSLLGYSLFGLDHIYLRSPMTGLLKFASTVLLAIFVITASSPQHTSGSLVLGGSMAVVAAMWYISDILEIIATKWGKSTHILNYGLSMPFDVVTGIGQGMITDKTTHNVQTASYVKYALMSLFGFLPFDAIYAGKTGLAFRKLVDSIVLGGGIYGLVKGAQSSPGVWGTIGLMIAAIPVFFVGICLLVPWAAKLSSLLDPTKLLSEGVRLDEGLLKFINYYASWTDNYPDSAAGTTVTEGVTRDFGYGSESPRDLSELFKIVWKDPADRSGSPPTTRTTSSTALTSVMLGNLPVGWAYAWLMKRFGMADGIRDSYAAAPAPAAPAPPPAAAIGPQRGGAVSDSLSTESKILGAVIVAITASGLMKTLVSSLTSD
jgi:hypothetical protein